MSTLLCRRSQTKNRPSPVAAGDQAVQRWRWPPALGVAGAADFGHYYLTTGRYLETTDDAYVKADSTIIAPKVSGYIAQVLVADNEPVKAGQLLARIDDRDFQRRAEPGPGRRRGLRSRGQEPRRADRTAGAADPATGGRGRRRRSQSEVRAGGAAPATTV